MEQKVVSDDKRASFGKVLKAIHQAKDSSVAFVNRALIDLYWSIGCFVQEKVACDGWGKATVSELSEYILRREPGIRGFSAQNIWRMKQFYETYKDFPELSTLLRENTWSNNLHIISKTNSIEEKECQSRDGSF